MVEQALTQVVRKGVPAQKTLQQFTYLALASQALEPGTVSPSTSATYARITAGPTSPEVPTQRSKPRPPLSRILARLQWIKKTRLGHRLWIMARSQIRNHR
jgi:hypothetical protein